MKLKKITVLVLFSTAVAPAFAAGGYVLGSVGQSDLRVDKSKLDDLVRTAGGTNVSSSLDSKDTAYKLQLGYQFNPYFAVEGGYVDLGKANYSASYTQGTASGNLKVTGWNIAAVGIYPLSDAFSMFGKLGVIDAKVEGSGSGTGLAGDIGITANSTKWRANYGLGLTYNATRNLGVRLEWERFDKVGETDKTTQFNADLISVGLQFSF